ncbi:MAG: FAD-dependent oxidoreductase, partial [Dongiaceae bacterium]
MIVLRLVPVKPKRRRGAGRTGGKGRGMALPTHVKYLVIGAGVHGLSSAWHLAENLRKSGRGSGQDILVVDKTGIAAGASGIAC